MRTLYQRVAEMRACLKEDLVKAKQVSQERKDRTFEAYISGQIERINIILPMILQHEEAAIFQSSNRNLIAEAEKERF